MGLSDVEVDMRFKMVSEQVATIGARMVEEDRNHRDKIYEKVLDLRNQLTTASKELELPEVEEISPSIPLVEQYRRLKERMSGLDERRKRVMAQYR